MGKDQQEGQALLVIKPDSRELVAPINCALTKQADGSHTLVCNREARKEEEQSAAFANASPAGYTLGEVFFRFYRWSKIRHFGLITLAMF